MSVFVNISKQIGHDAKKVVAIPDIDEAHVLADQVKSFDPVAFKAAFELQRFSPSPVNADEQYSMSLVLDAFNEVKEHWRHN